jgi:SAM-dependent methyltransferase
MSPDETHVKRVVQAALNGTGPADYARWRATTLGSVTEALEQGLVLDLMGSVAHNHVLDLGCGDGVLTATLAARGALATGIDIERAALRAAIRRTDPGQHRPPRFVQGRVERLPFADGVFDVAVAVTVLCIVPDSARVVAEAARVLRPGGRLVIGELGRWSTWAARRRIKGWLGSRLWRSARFYTPADLSLLLESAGLKVDAIRGAVYYPPVGVLAGALAPLEPWLGSVTTIGAAFIAAAATKQCEPCR